MAVPLDGTGIVLAVLSLTSVFGEVTFLRAIGKLGFLDRALLKSQYISLMPFELRNTLFHDTRLQASLHNPSHSLLKSRDI